VRDPADPSGKPAYFVLLGWTGDSVATIRDFRHARYVAQDAEMIEPAKRPQGGKSCASATAGRSVPAIVRCGGHALRALPALRITSRRQKLLALGPVESLSSATRACRTLVDLGFLITKGGQIEMVSPIGPHDQPLVLRVLDDLRADQLLRVERRLAALVGRELEPRRPCPCRVPRRPADDRRAPSGASGTAAPARAAVSKILSRW